MLANQTCDRCKNKSITLRMSRFNTEMCCPTCLGKEEKHPMYKEACRVELEEVKAGNMNFPGIGLPEDLKQ